MIDCTPYAPNGTGTAGQLTYWSDTDTLGSALCTIVQVCQGGANNGASCTAASVCPGGVCSASLDCPATAAGGCTTLKEGTGGGANTFKLCAPDVLTGDIIWDVPAADAVGYLHSSGGGQLTIVPTTSQWAWSQDDGVDLPTESHVAWIVNKGRPVTLSAVCCYADTNGATIALAHRATSVSQATAPLPTPAACATPGWSGNAGCIAATTAFATNDSLDWTLTESAGVRALRVVLPWAPTP